MQHAEVVPMLEQGCPLTVSNYRPISLLSVFSKISEKLMYKRLYNFLDVHQILFHLQFDFRASHSTNHTLINLTECIKNAHNNKNFACGNFIYLQKDFDTINHQILLHKLKKYGVWGTALDRFNSYLSNRCQYVSVNGHNSSHLNVTCGVPKGSVLGPLLFLIYLNDFPSSSKKLSFLSFC